MVKVCKRHADNPVMIYHQCVGCELEWFREELEQKQQEIERLKKQDIDVIISYAVERQKLIECLRFYERLARGREVNDGGRKARWEKDKNHGGFESAWNEFVERWSKFQKDWEGYFSQEGIKCPRVWDDVLGKMIYSTVEQFDDMLGFRFEQHLETETPVYMWPTGLRDKNGREIYEGDILDVDGTPWLVEPIGTEERDGGKFGLCASPYGSGEAYFIDKSILDGMVIGNIYENPRLLEGRT